VAWQRAAFAYPKPCRQRGECGGAGPRQAGERTSETGEAAAVVARILEEKQVGPGADPMMELRQDGDDVTLFLDGLELIRHTARRPALYAGRARLGYSVFKGRFRIRDRTRMEPLSRCEAAPLRTVGVVSPGARSP
jgi:hypothetical protein